MQVLHLPELGRHDVIQARQRLTTGRKPRIGWHRQAELREVVGRHQQIVDNLKVLPDATEVPDVERHVRNELALYADRELPVRRTMAPAGGQVLVIQLGGTQRAEREIRDLPAHILTKAVLQW